MAEETSVRYVLYTAQPWRSQSSRRLEVTTDEEAMAEAALAVLLQPDVGYRLVKVISRVVGRYTPVAALVKEWEGG